MRGGFIARLATPNRRFAYKRAEFVAALANGVTRVATSIWIFCEAIRRFFDPRRSYLGGWILRVAFPRLLVNVVRRAGAKAPDFAEGSTVAVFSGLPSDGEVFGGGPRDSVLAIRAGSSPAVHGFFTPPAYTGRTGKLSRR